jgi:copper transporter 1
VSTTDGQTHSVRTSLRGVARVVWAPKREATAAAAAPRVSAAAAALLETSAFALRVSDNPQDQCPLLNCTFAPSKSCPCPSLCLGPQVTCNGCMDGMSMPGCLYPGRCKNNPVDCPGCMCDGKVCKPADGCNNCMDGMPMDGCPDPYKCGFQPSCTNCTLGHPTLLCPSPDACLCPGGNPPQPPTPCSMKMTFGWGVDVCILFDSWHATSGLQYFFAVVMIAVTCIARELLVGYRANVARSGRRRFTAKSTSANGNTELLLGGVATSEASSVVVTKRAQRTTGERVCESALYALSVLLAYLIMLVVMSYNGGVFITVLMGSFAGHFIATMAWHSAGGARDLNSAAPADLVVSSGDSCCDQ